MLVYRSIYSLESSTMWISPPKVKFSSIMRRWLVTENMSLGQQPNGPLHMTNHSERYSSYLGCNHSDVARVFSEGDCKLGLGTGGEGAATSAAACGA